MTSRLRALVDRYREVILLTVVALGVLTFLAGMLADSTVVALLGVGAAVAASERIDRERPDTGPPPSDWGWP